MWARPGKDTPLVNRCLSWFDGDRLGRAGPNCVVHWYVQEPGLGMSHDMKVGKGLTGQGEPVAPTFKRWSWGSLGQISLRYPMARPDMA